MATMVTQTCWCGKQFEARAADVARGWGRSCCKKHAARARELAKQSEERLQSLSESYKRRQEPDYMRPVRTIDEDMLGLGFDWSSL